MCVSIFAKLLVSSSTNIRWCSRLHRGKYDKVQCTWKCNLLGPFKVLGALVTSDVWTLSVRCYSLLVSHANGTCRQPSRQLDEATRRLTFVPQSADRTARQLGRLKDWETDGETVRETHDTLPSGWQLVRFHLASLTEFDRRFGGDKRSLLDHTRLVAQLDSGRESYLIVYKPTLPSVVSHSRFSLSAPRRFEKCG